MKLSKLSMTFAALALAGANSVAHADSFAESYLHLTNFEWVDSTTGLRLSAGAGGQISLASIVGTNSGSASGNINAFNATPINDSSPVATGGAIAFSSTQVNGAGATAVDAVSPYPGFPHGASPLPADGTHSFASYELNGAIIDVAGAPAADAETLAQSGLVLNGSGHSQSNLGTNTSLTFTITADITTKFLLDYQANLLASVKSPFGVGDSANASLSWNLEVTDLGVGGVGGAGSIYSWNPAELNKSRGATAGQPNNIYNAAGSLDSSADEGLLTLSAGHTYNVTIGDLKLTDVTRDVAEPSSLALLGIGVLGLMVPAMRKRYTPSA